MGEVVEDEEIIFERGDGTRGTMCVSSSPIRDAVGTIIAAVGGLLRHHGAEAGRGGARRAREELERRVAERTADLAAANRALASEVAERRQAERARNDLLRRLVDVQEEERGRIARELHDQMGQQLTALKLGLEALAAATRTRPPVAEPAAAGSCELTREVGHEMHRIAWELRPIGPGRLRPPGRPGELRRGVVGAVRRARRSSSAPGWGDRLPPRVETTVYRVVQEALTNVAKHARAGRVSLILERRDDHVRRSSRTTGAASTRRGRPGPAEAGWGCWA